MAVAAPQLQWSVDNTAGGLLSVGRRLVEAATSDNVQVLALMACEGFGATLPISTITRLKVETLARRNARHTVTFLKAQVGYRAGDSADALAQSDGGLRFLCLAAVLCTFSTSFVTAAQTLDQMIRSNPRGDQKLPTMLQLRDLLQALSPKLSDSGFTSEVIGWTLLCAPDRQARSAWQSHGKRGFVTPGPSEFKHLLEAIQRCYRVGDSNTRVTVKSDLQYIPWTVAVVKWLTGATPSVRRLDGTTLLDSTDETVTIQEDRLQGCYLVSLLMRVESVQHIISAKGHRKPDQEQRCWLSGFLNVKSWLKARLDILDVEFDLADRLLWHVVDVLPDTVLLSKNIQSTAVAVGRSDSRQPLPRPFPNRQLRRRALGRMLPNSISAPGPSLEEVLGEVRQKCLPGCICNLQGDEPVNEAHRNSGHKEQAGATGASVNVPNSVFYPDSRCFKQRVGSVIADVLALLLFTDTGDDDPYPELSLPDFRTIAFGHNDHYSANNIKVQVYGERDQYRIAQDRVHWHALIVHGWWRILTGQWLYLSCSSEAIFAHVKQMVGHCKDSEDRDSDHALVLSRYGCVVYPVLLDAGVPFQEGFLRLVKRSGQLCWDDQVFTGMTGPWQSAFHPLSGYLRSISSPRDSFPCRQLDQTFVPAVRTGRQLRYDISVTTSAIMLNMDINTRSVRGDPVLCPWDLFYGLGQTLFSLPCAHHPGTAVGGTTTEDFSVVTRDEEDRPVSVVPGDKQLLCNLNGEDSLQLVQLGIVEEPCLLFSRGCLRCALDFASQHGIKFVVC